MKNLMLKKTIPSLIMMALLLVFAVNIYGQQASLTKLSVAKINPAAQLNNAKTDSVANLDTIRCMFHQVVNNRSMLTWRRGYIVLENDKILLGNVPYATVTASQLTGLIQNKFLSSNRKKVVKNQVVQVVLLQ